MKDLVLGLIAGAVGALVWAAVAYFTEYEIGWIAWGIGALVGYAVARGGEEGGRSPMIAGCLALLITALAIVAGKYGAIEMRMPDDAGLVELYMVRFEDEEYVISFLADDVAMEHASAGRVVAWPQGVDPSNAATQSEYAPEIWAEADSRWTAFSDEEKTMFRQQEQLLVQQNVEANLPAVREMLKRESFYGSFGSIDLLFFGLAMVTAFGMASDRKVPTPDPDSSETVGRTSA